MTHHCNWWRHHPSWGRGDEIQCRYAGLSLPMIYPGDYADWALHRGLWPKQGAGQDGGRRNPAKSCALTSIRSAQRMGSPFKIPTKHHKGQQQPCSSVLKPICKITVIGDKTVKVCLLLADSLVSLLALMNLNILDPHHHPQLPPPALLLTQWLPLPMWSSLPACIPITLILPPHHGKKH